MKSLSGYLTSWVCAFATVSGAAAQGVQVVTNSAAAMPAPRIAFGTTNYEFGKVTQGAVVKTDFYFTNTGNAVLEITAVKPGCGCTTAGTWDRRVEPGQTGKIPVEFNSTDFQGNISKGVTVVCNDPARRTTSLKVSGNVWCPITVLPSTAIFQAEAGEQTNQTRVVRIQSNMDQPLALSAPVSSSPFFKAELREVQPGRQFELHVSSVAPFPSNSVTGTIEVKTSSPDKPLLMVKAFGQLLQPIIASPSQIVLPAKLPPGPLQRNITIFSRGTNALQLTNARFSLPGAQLALEETQPGRVFVLRATFPGKIDLAPGAKAELSVETGNPKLPVMRIPVLQATGS